ncbi:MAG: hypothetical protein ACSHW0_11170 [Thalassotalea sp.]
MHKITLLLAMSCLIIGVYIGTFIGKATAPQPQSHSPTQQIAITNLATEKNQRPAAEQVNHSQQKIAAPNKKIQAEVTQYQPASTADGADIEIKILALEEQLITANNEIIKLNNEIIAYQSFIDEPLPEQNDNNNKKQPSSISLEQVEVILQQPFASIIANSTGNLVDQFNQLNAEAVDYDWATNLEQLINDYIVTHELFGDISIQSIMCKSTTCEIRGFTQNIQSPRIIFNSIRINDWWQFNSSHLFNQSSKEFGDFFYVLASIKKFKSD